MAFTYDTLEDLLLAYRQRLTKGLKPIWCVNHGPTMSMYYRDPDGNTNEMQVDSLDVHGTTAFLEGPEFAENPIGVDYDPEELIKRLENGEAFESMVKRPQAGPRGIDTIPPAMLA